MTRPERQFYFTPTYACNSNCRMCGVDKRKRNRKDAFSIEESKKLIDKMELSQDDILEFSGGEPTIYNGFKELLIYAREKYNPRIMILSNGRQLSNLSFVESLKDIGIERFIIPLFSDNEDVHDYLSQSKGSFTQTCIGFENLTRCDINFSIKVIAMRPNYKDIESVYNIKKCRFPGAGLIISGFQLMGEAVVNSNDVSIRHSMVSPYIERTLDNVENSSDFVPIFMFPMCLVDPYYWKYFGIGVYREEVVAPDQNEVTLNSQLNYERKTEKCLHCALDRRCTWAWKNYIKQYGDNELQPIYQ